MLPATTLPAAVPAGQDAAVSAVCAGPCAAPQPPAVSRTSWRDHRKTPPRDGDAALAELRAMGSLWRGAGGGIEEGPGPPQGSGSAKGNTASETRSGLSAGRRSWWREADRPRGTRPAKRVPDSVPGRARSVGWI